MTFRPANKEELQEKLLDITNDGDIPESWDLRNVDDFSGLFEELTDIDFDERFSFISDWDVEHVKFMSSTFADCKKFNIPLNWKVYSAETMEFMFKGCTNFNQPVGHWNVSCVRDMESMFKGCTNFNQPLNTWNVASVKNMAYMFQGCTHFNKPLNKWMVLNVEQMSYMFDDYKEFNKSLKNWTLNQHVVNANMFRQCPISKENRPNQPQPRRGRISAGSIKRKNTRKNKTNKRNKSFKK